MTAAVGPTRVLATESAGPAMSVWATFVYVVSPAPPQAYTACAWFEATRRGPGSARTWNVTVPAAPAATVPRSTHTTPFPPGRIAPASSPDASVRGLPFQRIVPGT